ncbi:triacylglycerol lipase [Dorcoceras hygrometricum]|uniref:Triacylglycerol lipase n=1 Tax=Dorcoceras hygrometricum TaxID=472368 RepID=A0A2Z7BAB5_9LAMI|nr:triacylglycerol lipase [Dorcoceras hygrometricum]
MVKRLATSPHDPLGITDSACNNQSVMVSVQYGPFNPYIPIRSTTIGKSRVAIDPIAMHTSWRSNSDITSVTRVSMTFRVVRTNQYNQDLGLIHSTNGNHLESPNEGSSIDHQVTIYLHAQNITMFPTNETWIEIQVHQLLVMKRRRTKVDIMASRLNDIQKDAEATKEALSHQLFKFQSPNQTLEEIRPAVTTSPETRRSIAGAAPPPRRSRRQRAAAARNSAPQRRASLDSARPGDAFKQRQRSASSATSCEFIGQHHMSSSLPPAMSRIIARQAAAHSSASRYLRYHAASAHKRWAAVGHARREAQQFALASTSARDMCSHVRARGGAAARGGCRWPTREEF